MPARKILLVEDDIDIRENMTMVLRYEGYEGYEVLQAEQGADAIAKLESCSDDLPDVILLDLFMPVMNGREFLDAIDAHARSEFQKIPVILITASEKNNREDLDTRTAAVLRKPIDLKYFLDLIPRVV